MTSLHPIPSVELTTITIAIFAVQYLIFIALNIPIPRLAISFPKIPYILISVYLSAFLLGFLCERIYQPKTEEDRLYLYWKLWGSILPMGFFAGLAALLTRHGKWQAARGHEMPPILLWMLGYAIFFIVVMISFEHKRNSLTNQQEMGDESLDPASKPYQTITTEGIQLDKDEIELLTKILEKFKAQANAEKA